MVNPEHQAGQSTELFDIFRHGAQLARDIINAEQAGIHSPMALTDELNELTYTARELVVDETLKVSTIDGNKRPFVHHFRVNELSMSKRLLGDLKTIPGHRGRYQAGEDYSMTMFPGFYRNRWPILGHVTGKALAVDLATSNIVMKQRGLTHADALMGGKTWVRLLDSDGQTPLVKVEFV